MLFRIGHMLTALFDGEPTGAGAGSGDPPATPVDPAAAPPPGDAPQPPARSTDPTPAAGDEPPADAQGQRPGEADATAGDGEERPALSPEARKALFRLYRDDFLQDEDVQKEIHGLTQRQLDEREAQQRTRREADPAFRQLSSLAEAAEQRLEEASAAIAAGQKVDADAVRADRALVRHFTEMGERRGGLAVMETVLRHEILGLKPGEQLDPKNELHAKVLELEANRTADMQDLMRLYFNQDPGRRASAPEADFNAALRHQRAVLQLAYEHGKDVGSRERDEASEATLEAERQLAGDASYQAALAHAAAQGGAAAAANAAARGQVPAKPLDAKALGQLKPEEIAALSDEDFEAALLGKNGA